MHLYLATRALHRRHMRDIRRWQRLTKKQDWHLRKVIGNGFIGYAYLWYGPSGTDAYVKCMSTEESVAFLHGVRDALDQFRHSLAHELTDVQPGKMYFTI